MCSRAQREAELSKVIYNKNTAGRSFLSSTVSVLILRSAKLRVLVEHLRNA